MGRGGLLLAVLALALAPAAPARADVPAGSDLFGINVNRVFNDDFRPSHWKAPLTAVRESGIRQARSDAFWMWAEPNPPDGGAHTYDWRKLDAEALALAQHGLRWLPILDYSTLWASSDPSDYHSPPTSNDDYAAYAGAFAERYGRGGSFWLAHPGLDPLPVTSYEVWNEPNGAWFWKPAPDPTAYADMYMKARDRIKAVDPEATVAVGGLVADTSYLEAMYAARPELKGNVDAVGWHPYAPTVDGVIGSVTSLRHTLERLGEPSVPIRVTEIGWPTSGDGSPIVLGEEARASALEASTDALARSDCGVAAVIPYTWTTPQQHPTDVEDWYGIRNPDGTPTRTSDAFERVVAQWNANPVADGTRLPLCHPPDADADGIPDSADACPTVSDLAAPLSPRTGCPAPPPPPPPDSDGDGIPDESDACPTVSDLAAPRSARNGCPVAPLRLRDTTAPVLDHFSATPAAFALDAGVAPIPAKLRAAPRGTTLGYRLSEPASVTLLFARRTAGRRSGRDCVNPKAKNRTARSCTRYVPAGSLTRSAAGGANTLRFAGRIGGSPLPLGSYRITATGRDRAGLTSPATTTSITLIRPH